MFGKARPSICTWANIEFLCIDGHEFWKDSVERCDAPHEQDGQRGRIWRIACFGSFLACHFQGVAQEVEQDLFHVFVPQLERTARSGGSGGVGSELPPMGLPFVDDFAWPSMYHEEGTVNFKRWERSPVRHSTTLAYQPPAIGCATLDGLDRLGNPYVLNEANPVGYAIRSRRVSF